MATNGRFDPELQYAALGERVEGQGRRLTNLENTVTQGFKQVEASIGGLAAEFRSSQRPQWQAIGVAITFAAMIGALAYWPIRENQANLKTQIDALTSVAITRAEMEWRQERGKEERARTETAILAISSALVPRQELDRVFQGYDQRFTDMQRQIDEGKAAFAGTFSLRDYIGRITTRLDRLEERRPYQPP